MATHKAKPRLELPALKVRQWLDTWDEVSYNSKASQAKPEPQFLLFSIKAGDLKALTGVYRRSTRSGTPRAKDPNVQRGHEEDRSETIRDFIKFGFPWCEMGEAKRHSPGAQELRKPGWLPTAIVVNILERGAVRNNKPIPDTDLVTVGEGNGVVSLVLPKSFTGSGWQPEKVFPLEVIDGQHRLWAFEDFDPGSDFELPVVAFHGLDRSWQAYLFWSINITPKRINRSLAFDLYPLLRREDWLDRFAGHPIYRETRCQELVEALWSQRESPWYQRINMLGETAQQSGLRVPTVSQAAWVRCLMASFVKQWEGAGTRLGGLFGAPASSDDPLLPWNRAMQAAFLIFAGDAVRQEIENAKPKWAEHLRRIPEQSLFEPNDDEAFYGEYSLLTTDQGIRGMLFIFNDLCYVRSKELKLSDWSWEGIDASTKGRRIAATESGAVSASLTSFAKTPAATFLKEIAKGLVTYDWRTSSTPDLTEPERLRQSVFRGSSGYREMRRQLLAHISKLGGDAGKAALLVTRALEF
jgi:DGQHR domain-containing protein